MADTGHPDIDQASSLLETFRKIGDLVRQQSDSSKRFNAAEAYKSSDKEGSHLVEILQFYRTAFRDMGVAKALEGKVAWSFDLQFKEKAILDDGLLYNSLRLLPDEDVRKIRIFNRFAGQENCRVSVPDIVFNELREGGRLVNPYFDNFQRTAREFAELCGARAAPEIRWPESLSRSPEFMEILANWRTWFVNLPGIRIAARYFGDMDQDRRAIFSEFFHIQRQFDSESWKDFDPQNNPYPQPLPRIASYRRAVLEMNSEFVESEGSISMCYDYCRMMKDHIIDYIRTAEGSFMKIVNRLDEDYPLEVDWCHRVLHERAHGLKHMLFPLRCIFYEELEAGRSVNESNDSTLDSYFEMSLGNTSVSIPSYYRHQFDLAALEPELRAEVEAMIKAAGGPARFRTPGAATLEAVALVGFIQTADLEFNKRHADNLSRISADYEARFKSDENNLSRRLARLFWMFAGSLAKKESMKAACQKRLDGVEKLCRNYDRRAQGLKSVDLEDEKVFMQLPEDQLPLLAPPDQMEDFFNTKAAVGRLAVDNSDFEQEAKAIEKGLEAALEMLKKSETFIERLVHRIFPSEGDRRDLLDTAHKLINLSYRAHRTLADTSRRAEMQKRRKTKDERVMKELEKQQQELQALKKEVNGAQERMREIVTEKRDLIKKMRITDVEKKNYLKQLRMITIMTVSSTQAQRGGQDLLDEMDAEAEAEVQAAEETKATEAGPAAPAAR